MINLTLHVVEAKNLINTGSVRVSDPYCKITVNNETKKSRAVHNTTNPRWDYRFYFQNVPLDAPIAIEVFDKNLIRSHSFMGRMYVTVNQLRQQSKGWWPLLSREGEGNLGSIYLQADFIELQRVLFNEMQYRYVNVPPQQGMVGQQAQVIPQGQTLVNQQPMQTVGSTTPIVIGQGLPPQVVTLPSQGQVLSGQGFTQNRLSYSSDSPDSERNSTYIPPQGFSGQQYPIQNQGLLGQSYTVQSGTTQSSLPQVQILSGQQLPTQRSLGETGYPQGQGISGQGLTGQSYPVQSGTNQSSFPQSQGLSGQQLPTQRSLGETSYPQGQGTPVSHSNQNENFKTESPYFERNNSRDSSDDTTSPDLSNRDSRQHSNRSIDSPLVGGSVPSTTNTSGLSGNQGNRGFGYIDFSLHVVEARNLHNTGTIRSSDPFLEISVAEESTKTKTVTNTVNPRWDETFSFKDVPAHGKILFQVFDRNLITSNQVMGRFETDINSLRERPSNWWTLYGPEGESTSGEIYLDCYFN